MVELSPLFRWDDVLIHQFSRDYCFGHYSFDGNCNINAIPINWPPFLPGLVCHSTHQLRTLELTQ